MFWKLRWCLYDSYSTIQVQKLVHNDHTPRMGFFQAYIYGVLQNIVIRYNKCHHSIQYFRVLL